MVKICTICFNTDITFCIYGFRMIFNVNSDYILTQCEIIDLCNGEVWCSL
jgi:hypothetical protein